MMEPQKADLPLAMIDQIQKTGRALEIINLITEHDIFDDLSKHNPYWEHEDEKIYDKLFETRCSLGWIQDQLIKVWDLLKVDPYEGSL